MKKKDGFTLVELLVVIGIIALLISILLPALGKARRTAQTAACLSNLHQLLLATTMYVNENKGILPGWDYSGTYYPNTTDWTESLAREMGLKWVYWAQPGDSFDINGNSVAGAKYPGNNIPAYRCPSGPADLLGDPYWIPRHPTNYVISFFASDPVYNHYWCNYSYSKTTQWKAASFPMFMVGFQISEPLPSSLTSPAWAYYVDPSRTTTVNSSVAFRHGTGNPADPNNNSRATNVVFLDGHAQTLRAADFWNTYPSFENDTMPGATGQMYRAASAYH
jgi:prepilin-type N-terminal cleavage/methylation domain-containing protein/prepilin-type processing-associated H-X9-DG protein